MANDVSDDELDGILAGALAAFDTPRRVTTISPEQAEVGSTIKRDPDEPKSADEGPPEVSAEAAKTFKDAVDALRDVNFEDGPGDENQEESDLQLAEEFLKGLENAFGGMVGANGGVPTGAAGSFGAFSAAGEAQTNSAPNAGGAQNIAPNVEKLVESVVGQLLSEDVLKTPMLNMRAAYQVWLPKHAESLSAEELGRYTQQQELVEKICEEYENGADSGAVMELLSKMQELGAPPAEVMKSLSDDSSNSDGGEFGGATPAEVEKMLDSCGMQ